MPDNVRIDPDAFERGRQSAAERAARLSTPTWARWGRHGNVLMVPEDLQPFDRHVTSDGTVVLEYRPPGFPGDEQHIADLRHRKRARADNLKQVVGES